MKKIKNENKTDLDSQVFKEIEIIKLQTACPYLLKHTDIFRENIYYFFISEYCEVI